MTAEQSRFDLPLKVAHKLLGEAEDRGSDLGDGPLKAGGTSLVAGRPGEPTAILAFSAAHACASGGAFLGDACCSGPSVFVSAVQEERTVLRWLRAAGATKHPLLLHAGPVLFSDPADPIQQLRQLISKHEAVLLVLDPLMAILPIEKINDNSEVARVLYPVLYLARETGCHVMLTHLARKKGGPVFEAILGGTVLADIADSALLVESEEDDSGINGTATVRTVRRNAPRPTETHIIVDPFTGQVTVPPYQLVTRVGTGSPPHTPQVVQMPPITDPSRRLSGGPKRTSRRGRPRK